MRAEKRVREGATLVEKHMGWQRPRPKLRIISIASRNFSNTVYIPLRVIDRFMAS
jgi:hypothetical protein